MTHSLRFTPTEHLDRMCLPPLLPVPQSYVPKSLDPAHLWDVTSVTYSKCYRFKESTVHRFNELLKQLVEVEAEDADLHYRESTLTERARVHDKLVAMRADLASLREELGFDHITVSGNDVRTRRLHTRD